MTASSLTWFDDEPPDLRRWTIAALVVLGFHLAAIASYVYIHQPDRVGDDTAPIVVDFTPIDIVNQPAVTPAPEPPPEVEKPPPPPPPPPPPEPQTVVAPETPPPPPPKVEEPPPKPAPSQAARIAPAWEANLVKHLERYKPAPSEHEEGIVILGITVEHNGHVLSHRIVRSSGHPDLDDAVIAMIEHAQPLPPFPASMTEDKLDLTIPIRFSLR